MGFVSNNFQINKLNQKGINIKTIYASNGNRLERNSDNSKNDNVVNGVILEKLYYHNNNLLYVLKDFDPRITYSFISSNEIDKYNKCPNCGYTSILSDFINGCPYCGTYYNIDYTDKELGNKYHYDRVLKTSTYRIVTLFVDIIISFILCFFFVILTNNRTFNQYDISKIIVYSIILSLVLYYLFYIIDARIVIGPIKRYKDKLNKKQMEFWERTKIDKKTFYNNLNYELSKYYYSQDNIIDYDIMDYISFDGNNESVNVSFYVRVVTINNNKITSNEKKETITMVKNKKDILELKDGKNIIKCRNCGASIDVNKEKCEHCNTKINGLTEWIRKEF